MSLTLFDELNIMKAHDKTIFELGVKLGSNKEYARKLINKIIKKVNEDKSFDVIVDEINEDVDIRFLYDTVIDNLGKKSEDIFNILDC